MRYPLGWRISKLITCCFYEKRDKIMKYILCAYLCVIFFLSITTFILFGIDKRKAIHHSERIKEKTLLCLIYCGGALGGALGSILFHHKTKKMYFRLSIAFTLLLEIVLLIGIVILMGK